MRVNPYRNIAIDPPRRSLWESARKPIAIGIICLFIEAFGTVVASAMTDARTLPTMFKAFLYFNAIAIGIIGIGWSVNVLDEKKNDASSN